MKSKKASGFGFEARLSITGKAGMRQHTAFPARKIAMSYTQLAQDERYHIQYLSRHCAINEDADGLIRQYFPKQTDF